MLLADARNGRGPVLRGVMELNSTDPTRCMVGAIAAPIGSAAVTSALAKAGELADLTILDQ